MPENPQTEVATRKKFLGNTIKLTIDRRVGEAQDESLRQRLLDQLRLRTGYSPKKLTRVLGNTDVTTVQELLAASEVLNVTLEELIKTEVVELEKAA